MANPLHDWERETELALALVALLRADPRTAIARADRWQKEAWVARCIVFSAYAGFLHEPAKAMEVYGGVAPFEAMSRSNSVESLFGRGLSAMFMRKAPEALALFKAAATPADPFTAFCLVALTTGPTWPKDEQQAAAQRFATHAAHPLAGAAAIMFR